MIGSSKNAVDRVNVHGRLSPCSIDSPCTAEPSRNRFAKPARWQAAGHSRTSAQGEPGRTLLHQPTETQAAAASRRSSAEPEVLWSSLTLKSLMLTSSRSFKDCPFGQVWQRQIALPRPAGFGTPPSLLTCPVCGTRRRGRAPCAVGGTGIGRSLSSSWSLCRRNHGRLDLPEHRFEVSGGSASLDWGSRPRSRVFPTA